MASSNYVSPVSSSKADSDNDLASPEGEIFFGPMSEKEEKLARRLMKRRTELYCPRYAIRQSLLEFRKAHGYLTIDEDEPSRNFSKSDSSLEDSLEEKPHALHDGPSNCEDSYSEDETMVKVDRHLVFTEEYAAMGSIELLSATARTIENANDSLEIHSRRSSSYKLKNELSDDRPFVEQETGDLFEIVPETSFEQDSGTGSSVHNRLCYFMPSVALEEQMEHLDLETHSELACQCNESMNMPNEINDEIVKIHTLKSVDFLPERTSVGSDTVLPAPPGIPEISYDSISSEEFELSTAFHNNPPVERGESQESSCVGKDLSDNQDLIVEDLMKINLKTSENNADQWEDKYVSLVFKPDSENFVSVLNFKKLFASPLPLPRSSAIGIDLEANEFAEDPEKMADNCAYSMCNSQHSESLDFGTSTGTAELQAPANVCPSLQKRQEVPLHISPERGTVGQCLLPGLENTKNCGAESEIVEHGLEVEKFPSINITDNQQCQTECPSGISSVKDDLQTNGQDKLTYENEEQFERCLNTSIHSPVSNFETVNVKDNAMIRCCNQNDPVDISAKEQACQTSFLGYSMQGSASNSSAKKPNLKTALTQKTRRIPIRIASTVTPDKAIFKMPSHLPERGISAGGSTTTTAAAPQQQQQRITPVATGFSAANRLTPKSGSRFQHIVSPVAKYIKDSPLPTLIASNRPLLARTCKGRMPPNHKFQSATKIPLVQVTSVNRQRKTACKEIVNDELPIIKAKNKLNFDSTSKKGNKENQSIEDSIIQDLGISCEELHQIDNQKLKDEVIKFIREKKALIEKNQNAQNDPDAIYDSSSSGATLPCMNYTGASSLAMKEVDIVTKLYTTRNKMAPLCSPCQPKILKHTGERKMLHWASDIVSNPNQLSSPSRPNAIAPAIYKHTIGKNSADFCDANRSTIDVSIVEVVIPKRTNTLSKQ